MRYWSWVRWDLAGLVIFLLIAPWRSHNGNGLRDALTLSIPVTLLVLLGSGVLITIARHRGRQQRTGARNCVLFLSSALLLWLDAGPVILAVGLMAGVWWSGYLFVACVFTPFLLANTPRGSRERRKSRRLVAALWAWAVVCLLVPWNVNKLHALRFLHVKGESAQVFAEGFGDSWIYNLSTPEGQQFNRGWEVLRDVPVDELGPNINVNLGPEFFGSAVVEIRNDQVTGFWFLYD